MMDNRSYDASDDGRGKGRKREKRLQKSNRYLITREIFWSPFAFCIESVKSSMSPGCLTGMDFKSAKPAWTMDHTRAALECLESVSSPLAVRFNDPAAAS